MRASLGALLATGRVLLADGATGTNLQDAGLGLTDAPERWVLERPDAVRALHHAFVDAGADIVLTDTFGANRVRLAASGLAARTGEIARRAAELACEAADAAPRPVVVAGSVGPLGVRLAAEGPLAWADAVAAFREAIEGLRDGGAAVAWIETMWAADEARAAAQAAIDARVPYVVTCSFDHGGRTGAGLAPAALPAAWEGLAEAPLAYGANCGVGPADVVASVLALAGAAGDGAALVAKANAGLPRREDGRAVYDRTPAEMAEYARLAVDAGARIVGGCCGTTPQHVAAMRAALDDHVRARPRAE